MVGNGPCSRSADFGPQATEAAYRYRVVGIGRGGHENSVAPARGPLQGDFLLDQSSAFDPTEPEPVPEYPLDPSLPDDLDD